MLNKHKKWRAAPFGVALHVLAGSYQVAEDTGNTPHGLVRLRIAKDMKCIDIVVMLSPFFFLRPL